MSTVTPPAAHLSPPPPGYRPPTPVTEAHLAAAAARDVAMRAAYDRAPGAFADHAQPTDGGARLDSSAALRKRLLYRSRQRGW